MNDYKRKSSVIERDNQSLLKRLTRCLRPMFAYRIVNVDTKCTIACNFVMIVAFVVIGLLIRSSTSDIETFTIRFDDKCGDAPVCQFPFFVKKTIKGPIYVYLHFKDFYVQHRASLKSVSHEQLSG